MRAFKPVILVAMIGLGLAQAPHGLAKEPAVAAAAVVPATASDYRIGAYDVIDIDVFEINDLHREVQVDGAGRILLPLIGPVQAQGLTIAQLSDDLREKLEAKYVNSAKVTVQVKQSQSQHVTVDGAVTSPGVYTLGGHTTLLQAIAMAQGPAGADANVHKVSLFHTVDSRWIRSEYDLAKIRNGQVEDPVVEGKDVVIVAGSRKQRILQDLGAVLPMVMLLGAL